MEEDSLIQVCFPFFYYSTSHQLCNQSQTCECTKTKGIWILCSLKKPRKRCGVALIVKWKRMLKIMEYIILDRVHHLDNIQWHYQYIEEWFGQRSHWTLLFHLSPSYILCIWSSERVFLDLLPRQWTQSLSGKQQQWTHRHCYQTRTSRSCTCHRRRVFVNKQNKTRLRLFC